MLWLDSFLDYLRYERNYSEDTVIAYRTDILQLQSFCNGVDGEFDATKIAPEDVREWIVYMMDKAYTATSINRKLSSLRSFYKFLMRTGKLEKDPLSKVVGPKNKKMLPVFLKESEMDRLLDDVPFKDNFKGCRDRMILVMFYETGIRLSELIGLNDALAHVYIAENQTAFGGVDANRNHLFVGKTKGFRIGSANNEGDSRRLRET